MVDFLHDLHTVEFIILNFKITINLDTEVDIGVSLTLSIYMQRQDLNHLRLDLQQGSLYTLLTAFPSETHLPKKTYTVPDRFRLLQNQACNAVSMLIDYKENRPYYRPFRGRDNSPKKPHCEQSDGPIMIDVFTLPFTNYNFRFKFKKVYAAQRRRTKIGFESYRMKTHPQSNVSPFRSRQLVRTSR